MKTNSKVLALCLFLLLPLAGCIQKRIVWSPDAARAIVLADEHLYLCDANGKLGAPLLQQAVLAAWFQDSKRFVAVRKSERATWAELKRSLPAATQQHVQAQAAIFQTRVLSGVGLAEGFNSQNPADTLSAGVQKAVQICFRDTFPEALQQLKTAEQATLAALESELFELVVVELSGDALGAVRTVTATLDQMWEIQPSPSGAVIAYSTGDDADDAPQLWIADVHEKSPPQLLEEYSSTYFTWSQDQRSLLYFRPLSPEFDPEKGALGTLIRRPVLNESGKVHLETPGYELAYVLFSPWSQVQALSDGRIFFTSYESQFPAGNKDFTERLQLFWIDPARGPVVHRALPREAFEELPDEAFFFEVSPTGQKACVASFEGAVQVIDLASGDVHTLQPEGRHDLTTRPSWRGTNQLSYISWAENSETGQLVLYSEDHPIQTLSSEWPAQVRKGLLE